MEDLVALDHHLDRGAFALTGRCCCRVGACAGVTHRTVGNVGRFRADLGAGEPRAGARGRVQHLDSEERHDAQGQHDAEQAEHGEHPSPAESRPAGRSQVLRGAVRRNANCAVGSGRTRNRGLRRHLSESSRLEPVALGGPGTVPASDLLARGLLARDLLGRGLLARGLRGVLSWHRFRWVTGCRSARRGDLVWFGHALETLRSIRS